jgi:predicted dinucleotide-binding enzyme
MKIGIHGRDARAAAIGRLLVDGGYDVSSSDVGTDSSVCDMLIFAGPRGGTAEILEQLGRIETGTVIVDAMEGMPSLLSRRVVRASIAVPRSGMSVFLSGTNAAAIGLVGDVFRASGCVPVLGA